jgi:regulator of replication initiation timing
MNFAFYVKKDGIRRALPSSAGDTLALLETFGILGKRLGSMINFFSGKDLKRVDFVYKLYYPIFLVKCGEHVVPIDGMALSRVRIDEHSETDGGYELFGVRVFDFPLVKEAEFKISEWIMATTEEEIEDGYAMAPVMDGDEAIKIAKEFTRIHHETVRYREKVKSQLNSIEEHLKDELEQIIEEYNHLHAEYDGKVTQKNTEIEGLLTGTEESMIKELEAEIKKERETLREGHGNLNRVLKESQDELRTIDSRLQDCDSKRNTWDEEIQKVEKRLKALIAKKAKVEEGRESFDGLKGTVGELEEAKKTFEQLKMDLNGLVEESEKLKTDQSKLRKKVEELQVELDRTSEKERLIPSREDMKRRGINESFAERRRILIQGLNELLSEKERRMLEIRAKENKLRRENERDRKSFNVIFEALDGELKRLKELLWSNGEMLENKAEILHIPFYLISTDKKLHILEPPLLIRGYKRVEHQKRMRGIGGALSLIEGDWNTLSVLIYEARETFNLLNEKNRGRILRGIESLKKIKAISRTQEAMLLKGCISK